MQRTNTGHQEQKCLHIFLEGQFVVPIGVNYSVADNFFPLEDLGKFVSFQRVSVAQCPSTIPEVAQEARLFHNLLEVVLVVLEITRLSFIEWKGDKCHFFLCQKNIPF